MTKSRFRIQDLVRATSPEIRRCLVVAVIAGVAFWLVGPAGAPAPPPTVSILNPKPGTPAAPTLISPTSDNRFKVQVWNPGADTTGVAVGSSQGPSPDSGSWTWVAATLNANYTCGTNCGIYEAILILAEGDYSLLARAVSAGNGTRYSRDNRTGTEARYVSIRVLAPDTGTGTLLVREASSQLCLDCHSLPSHSSQSTGTKYGNWQLVCLDCHTPHNTRNLALIRETITTPNSGAKSVAFATTTGDSGSSSPATSSYVNAEVTGPCQVCHTQTQGPGGAARWRNSGDADAHYTASAGSQRCTTCHRHAAGFAHGTGTGGSGCIACHGHDAGYEYAPGQVSQGKGTAQSHSTHTENDADDLRGPLLACADCHNTASFPAFKDGATSLAATTVCNTCHSPGGTYDGVNDPAIGAMANWRAGIYENGQAALKSGKDKWCATCHDEAPAIIAGVSAPNVIGDEDGSYAYGVGWGYYKTGHGLPSSQTYPASGGVTAGAGQGCDSCHVSRAAHSEPLRVTLY